MTDPAKMMKARLRADLKIAMQAKHAAETQAIRNLLAAIDNAEAVPIAEQRGNGGDGATEMPRMALSDAELQALLLREAGDRAKAADEMQRLGCDDRAEMLRVEGGIVTRYIGG
ncbi:GatB/YqeY domain-containing protein [Sphingomonas sp. MMS24-J13]|uniref:GatB/YqeY domain-containing protein n=1 Tax=Sphingomonas sp. MMS24-J13 TaxID=3238686 RepID=UPI003850B16E